MPRCRLMCLTAAVCSKWIGGQQSVRCWCIYLLPVPLAQPHTSWQSCISGGRGAAPSPCRHPVSWKDPYLVSHQSWSSIHLTHTHTLIVCWCPLLQHVHTLTLVHGHFTDRWRRRRWAGPFVYWVKQNQPTLWFYSGFYLPPSCWSSVHCPHCCSAARWALHHRTE